MTEWRHALHSYPEAAFEEFRTAAFVAGKLREFGFEVTENIGKTGVVGVLKNGDSPLTVALRADMDSNCMDETTGLSYASSRPGRMHACGHDGHTATLLGAAKMIAEERAFSGTVVLVFQPAEEPGLGADAMIADGLIEKFGIQEIYGQHNFVHFPAGRIYICDGPCMASEDDFVIRIKGCGGHASSPHKTKDPLVTGAELVLALQTIVSRSVNPIKPAVVSCTQFRTDGVRNAIPSAVEIEGDCRSYDPEVSVQIEERMRSAAEGICGMNGAECEVEYTREFSATVNDAACAEWAAKAAERVFGPENTVRGAEPLMGSEDFAKYLHSVPGCYVFLGARDDGHVYLNHNSKYDFNDELLLSGAEWFAQLVRLRMA